MIMQTYGTYFIFMVNVMFLSTARKNIMPRPIFSPKTRKVSPVFGKLEEEMRDFSIYST